MLDSDGIADEILDLEARRCAALLAGDVATLGDLLSDDLVHIHGNGQVDGKTQYLEGVEGKYVFRELKRGHLDVRAYGEFAVVIGSLEQTIEVRETGQIVKVEAIVSQTWIRADARWRQNTCHMHFLKVG